MKFILLAISLFVASNTYALINTESYIYSNDSNEDRLAKEQLRISENRLAEVYLETYQKNKKAIPDSYAKSEVVFEVGDTSKKDVGAKIGMTKDQVMNKSYRGKPYITKTGIDDEYGKLELWLYKNYKSTNIHGILIFRNDKLTHIVN